MQRGAAARTWEASAPPGLVVVSERLMARSHRPRSQLGTVELMINKKFRLQARLRPGIVGPSRYDRTNNRASSEPASRATGPPSPGRSPNMCLPGQPPATAARGADIAQAALGWLAGADVASLTTAEQADCLRARDRAASGQTPARSRVRGAFH